MSVDETLMCSFQILKVSAKLKRSPFSKKMLKYAFENILQGHLSNFILYANQLLINFFLSFQPADKKKFPYGGLNSGRPITPPRGANQKKAKK